MPSRAAAACKAVVAQGRLTVLRTCPGTQPRARQPLTGGRTNVRAHTNHMRARVPVAHLCQVAAAHRLLHQQQRLRHGHLLLHVVLLLLLVLHGEGLGDGLAAALTAAGARDRQRLALPAALATKTCRRGRCGVLLSACVRVIAVCIGVCARPALMRVPMPMRTSSIERSCNHTCHLAVNALLRQSAWQRPQACKHQVMPH
jgi:hypothetical protein